MEGFIETYSGRKFYLEDPQFSIFDIAAALEKTCRFGGHIRGGFYSVAAHSVLVALIMEEEGWGEPLEGLLHDAPEAYIGDMPTPFKQYLPDFQKVHDRLDVAVRQQFGLLPYKTRGCGGADTVALLVEAKHLQQSGGLWIQASMEVPKEYRDLVAKYSLRYFEDKLTYSSLTAKGNFFKHYQRYLVRRYEPDAPEKEDQEGVRSEYQEASGGDGVDN